MAFPPPFGMPPQFIPAYGPVVRQPTRYIVQPVFDSFPPNEGPHGTVNVTPQLERPPVTTVFVGNIHEKCSNDLIKAILEECGSVFSWKRIQDANGKFQTFGFCEFGYPEHTLRALRILHGWPLGGKKLIVTVDDKTKEFLHGFIERKRYLAWKCPQQFSWEKSDLPSNESMKNEDDTRVQAIFNLVEQHVKELTTVTEGSTESEDTPTSPTFKDKSGKEQDRRTPSPAPREDRKSRSTRRSRERGRSRSTLRSESRYKGMDKRDRYHQREKEKREQKRRHRDPDSKACYPEDRGDSDTKTHYPRNRRNLDTKTHYPKMPMLVETDRPLGKAPIPSSSTTPTVHHESENLASGLFTHAVHPSTTTATSSGPENQLATSVAVKDKEKWASEQFLQQIIANLNVRVGKGPKVQVDKQDSGQIEGFTVSTVSTSKKGVPLLEQTGKLTVGRGAKKESQILGLNLPKLSFYQHKDLAGAKDYAMEQSIKQVLMKQAVSHQANQQKMAVYTQALSLLARIYVGSVSFELTEETIRSAFSPFGPIKSLTMSWDPVTGRHKGFAFLEYYVPEAAVLAERQMNGFLLGRRNIKVGRPTNMPQALPIIEKIMEEAKQYNRIYIGSIHPDLTEADVRSVFEVFGNVTNIELAKNTVHGSTNGGYGYLEYDNRKSTVEAVAALNLFNLGGQDLRVCKAITPPQAQVLTVSAQLPIAAAVAAASVTAHIQAMEAKDGHNPPPSVPTPKSVATSLPLPAAANPAVVAVMSDSTGTETIFHRKMLEKDSVSTKPASPAVRKGKGQSSAVSSHQHQEPQQGLGEPQGINKDTERDLDKLLQAWFEWESRDSSPPPASTSIATNPEPQTNSPAPGYRQQIPAQASTLLPSTDPPFNKDQWSRLAATFNRGQPREAVAAPSPRVVSSENRPAAMEGQWARQPAVFNNPSVNKDQWSGLTATFSGAQPSRTAGASSAGQRAYQCFSPTEERPAIMEDQWARQPAVFNSASLNRDQWSRLSATFSREQPRGTAGAPSGGQQGYQIFPPTEDRPAMMEGQWAKQPAVFSSNPSLNRDQESRVSATFNRGYSSGTDGAPSAGHRMFSSIDYGHGMMEGQWSRQQAVFSEASLPSLVGGLQYHSQGGSSSVRPEPGVHPVPEHYWF